jgi:hypothetical protein
MPAPGEHNTVLACFLAFAQEVGRRFVPCVEVNCSTFISKGRTKYP